jgi:hypothetical protein
VAREFDNRSDATLGEDSLARKLGAKKPWGALETVTRTSAPDAHARVTEARSLAKLPVLEQAVTDATLSRAQAAVIAAPILSTLHAADPATVDLACRELVEMARVLPATAVADAAGVWKAVLDPDGIEPDERRAIDKRFFRLGPARDGIVKISGLLPVEMAGAIRTVLDAYRNPRAGASVAFHPAENAEGDASNGDGDNSGVDVNAAAEADLAAGQFPPPRDTRSPEQKDADTLHMLFSAHARSDEAPTMGGAHPTILVTVTKENLETGRGAAWIDGERDPISAKAAKRIAETGGYQEVELSKTGEILSLGTAVRCFTPAQRRALAARDKGCVIPACPVPARWTEAHHLKPARDGGPTDVINAALLCWWHHFIIDDGPYQLRMGDTGVPEVRWVFGSHASPWIRAVHTPAL